MALSREAFFPLGRRRPCNEIIVAASTTTTASTTAATTTAATASTTAATATATTAAVAGVTRCVGPSRHEELDLAVSEPRQPLRPHGQRHHCPPPTNAGTG